MNRGGIFSGPNALGNVSLGAVGVSCQPDNSALIKQVQAYLNKNGCPTLKIDGVWQGCTASAFRKVTGRPYVTCEDIKHMTGQDCSSDDCLLGGILPGFTIPSINLCTDQSDGCPGGNGSSGDAYEQQCPAGQVWNSILRTCVPDIFGQGNNQEPTPQQTTCPVGQTWNDLLKTCIPDITQVFGGGSGGGSGGGGSVPNATECPSGTIKNPLDGKCYGTGSPTGAPPTECGAGMTKVPFLGCVTNPFGGGSQTTAQGGATNPIGGIIGAIQGMLGGGQQQSTPGGQTGAPGGNMIGDLFATLNQMLGGGVQCPPGSVFDPMTKGCTSAAGPVPPGGGGVVQPPASPFGSMTYAIGGLLLLGAVGGGYYLWKRKQEAGEWADYDGANDPVVQQILASESGIYDYDTPELGMGEYDDPAYGFYPNRRRRGRKSRRRSRRCR